MRPGEKTWKRVLGARDLACPCGTAPPTQNSNVGKSSVWSLLATGSKAVSEEILQDLQVCSVEQLSVRMTQAPNSGDPKDVQPLLSEMGSWILLCSPRLLYSRTSVHTSTFSSVEHQCVCQLCRCDQILKIIIFF